MSNNGSYGMIFTSQRPSKSPLICKRNMLFLARIFSLILQWISGPANCLRKGTFRRWETQLKLHFSDWKSLMKTRLTFIKDKGECLPVIWPFQKQVEDGLCIWKITCAFGTSVFTFERLKKILKTRWAKTEKGVGKNWIIQFLPHVYRASRQKFFFHFLNSSFRMNRERRCDFLNLRSHLKSIVLS